MYLNYFFYYKIIRLKYFLIYSILNIISLMNIF